jgi:hypothetical protein
VVGVTNKEYIDNKINDINKNEKNVLKTNEINKLKKVCEDNNYTKKEIDKAVEETIKNHFYVENKKNEIDENKNLSFDILEKDKNNIYIKLETEEKALLKTYKPLSLLDLEVAITKIAYLFDIKVVTTKRIKYENKSYLLILKDEYQEMSKLISIDRKRIKESDEIIRVIEKPFEIYKSNEFKKDYITMILFSLITSNENINLDSYGIDADNNLAPLYTFIYEENNKELNEEDIILNNCIVDKNLLINILFENYFNEISEFIFNNLNDKKIKKINNIIDLEMEPKEAIEYKELLLENIELLKKINKNKVIELYNSYGITNYNDILSYLSKNVEFGINVVIDDESQNIPFGALESTEGRNNQKVTYDNPEIIAFLNKYYSKHKSEINPLNLDVSQMLINISASTDIINKYYKINYPLSIFNTGVANSIEQMEFISYFLECLEIPVKRYCFAEANFNNAHYFTVFNVVDKWIYLENALADFKGIYEYNSLEELIDVVISKMIYYNESNPDKEINEKKYVLKELNKIDSNLKLNEMNDILKKTNNVDIKNAVYLYTCENEIRKNILNNEIKVFHKKDIYTELKPDEMPDINEYNAEYIRLLQANIMNIVYKDKYSVNDYYILNREGKLDLSTKKNEIVVVKEDEVETVNDRKFVIFKIFIILIVFIILWITFVM